MADLEIVDTTQQVTSKTPTTRQKNPKRVAAVKLIAEKTEQAREAQEKELAEAQVNHVLEMRPFSRSCQCVFGRSKNMCYTRLLGRM